MFWKIKQSRAVNIIERQGEVETALLITCKLCFLKTQTKYML